ncbi:MAG: hypothetical protein ACYDC1_06145 [Limisphaerales bacterium]
MPPYQDPLKELADRKRLLILQADLHRALLRAELTRVGGRLEWLELVREKVCGRPWLLAGGAAAGLLTSGYWRPALKWLPGAIAAWRWFGKLKRR